MSSIPPAIRPDARYVYSCNGANGSGPYASGAFVLFGQILDAYAPRKRTEQRSTNARTVYSAPVTSSYLSDMTAPHSKNIHVASTKAGISTGNV